MSGDEQHHAFMPLSMEDVLDDSPIVRNKLKKMEKDVDEFAEQLLKIANSTSKLAAASKGVPPPQELQSIVNSVHCCPP